MIKAGVLVLASCGTALACDTQGSRLISDDVDAQKAYVSIADIPLAQPFSMQVKVCDPAVAKRVRVDAIMPAHQHGMNYRPEVTGMGDGLFAVDGMLFHMPGMCEVRVTIDFDDKSVAYTHAVSVQ
jgi:hypothetical protein